MRFDVDTQASPEQARRAFTDFSNRRAQIWSRTLDPRTYELRGQGDTWAVARESTPGSPFWAVARYDRSDPAVIRPPGSTTCRSISTTLSVPVGPSPATTPELQDLKVDVDTAAAAAARYQAQSIPCSS